MLNVEKRYEENVAMIKRRLEDLGLLRYFDDIGIDDMGIETPGVIFNCSSLKMAKSETILFKDKISDTITDAGFVIFSVIYPVSM